MATYVLLVNFTEQGIRKAEDSPKRADTFKAMAKKSGVNVKEANRESLHTPLSKCACWL